MARPKPKVLMSMTNPKTHKSEQVLEAKAIFAVFLAGQPINLRTINSVINYPGPKYKRISFTSSGSAFNLADKLNKMFKTDEFQVVKLTTGEIITEIKDEDLES